MKASEMTRTHKSDPLLLISNRVPEVLRCEITSINLRILFAEKFAALCGLLLSDF